MTLDSKDRLKFVYYDQKEPIRHQLAEIKFKFKDRKFRFITDAGMFSRFKVDTGTKFLLRNLDINSDDCLLDMCCGYGVVGIISAKFCKKIVMSDINERVVEMVKRNIEINNVNADIKFVPGDLFENINLNEKFTIIATNPPLRAGMDFMTKLIEGAEKRLMREAFYRCKKKTGGKRDTG
ncbi:MAG: 16S rRNA methyltransferase [Candidatus Altiarchaeales archaeon HGW-Altiarchaeales-3]|nr:MAG: 16S rRNA methyltransferase [Candidatus Altiarchaeales archaeon HGW-Altiarchaeales-3]